VRQHDPQTLLCAFNFSDRAAQLALPADWRGASVLEGSGLAGARVDGDQLLFEPYGGLFLQRP
jgi:alpha-glucosidase